MDYLVSIAGLRLTNARANFTDSFGGAIYSGHSLALDSVVVENNIARSGGGIGFAAQYPGQSATITNSLFLNNVANQRSLRLSSRRVPAAPWPSRNDALDFPSTKPVTVTIANSEFRGNLSQPVTFRGRGGAIGLFSLADITISDTRIVDNHVEAPNPPAAGMNYQGGGIFGTANSLRIERSEISENTAYDVSACDVTRGGGMSLYNDETTRQGPGDAMASGSLIPRSRATDRARRPAPSGRTAMWPSNWTTPLSATTSRRRPVQAEFC